MKDINVLKHNPNQDRQPTTTELVQMVIKADAYFNVIAKTAWAHNGVARGKVASVLDSDK